MQIANSLAGGTSYKVYNNWKLLSPSKRRRLNASFQSQNVDFLTCTRLKNKTLNPNLSIKNSRLFFPELFSRKLLLSWIYYACSLRYNITTGYVYPREKSKGLWQQYYDFQLMTTMRRWATGKLTTTHNSVPVEIFRFLRTSFLPAWWMR